MIGLSLYGPMGNDVFGRCITKDEKWCKDPEVKKHSGLHRVYGKEQDVRKDMLSR